MYPKRINSLKFTFPDSQCAKPNDIEIVKFAKQIGVTETEVEAVYAVLNEKAIVIKFYTEDQMKQRKEVWVGKMFDFEYENGIKVQLKSEEASKDQKYVRIFNLIPEIEDADVKIALQRYGKIVKIIREKYPSKLGLNVFNGTRGVYMELSSDIPQSIFIKGNGARIYYDGIKEQCFKCGALDHKKKECQRTVQQRLNGVASYSDVLTADKPIADNVVPTPTTFTPVVNINNSKNLEETLNGNLNQMDIDEDYELIESNLGDINSIKLRDTDGEEITLTLNDDTMYKIIESGKKVKLSKSYVKLKRLEIEEVRRKKPLNKQ